ncbi:MAG: diguanylate cyclase, partial [Silanimonas lenta]
MSRPTTVTRRVLLPSLLLSALVGLLAVLAQLAWIVADERRAAKEQLELVRESTVPSLEEALWGINTPQIEAILQGLVENPAVARVVLTDEEGRRRVFGDARQGVLETGRFPLRYRKAGDLPLGELEVSLGDAVLKGRLIRRGFGTLLVLVLALGVSAVAGAWLFRQRVGRPLAAVTRRIERFSVRSPESADDRPLRPHAANDEIDRLETALRVMRAQVSRDVREIERLRDEIAAHAATLEAQVRERTAELEQRNRELEEQRRAVEALANTDALTGALSRRHFLELAGRERARAAREGGGLAVLLLDIDHFKRVND